jgi:hypothetical protein
MNNFRLDSIALRDHYEGIRILTSDITYADSPTTLKKSGIACGGKSLRRSLPPHSMFSIKQKKGFVYSNAMKLCHLLQIVNANFISHVKDGNNIELTCIPIKITYEQALAVFRNEVNPKFPQQPTTANKTSPYINELGPTI